MPHVARGGHAGGGGRHVSTMQRVAAAAMSLSEKLHTVPPLMNLSVTLITFTYLLLLESHF